MKSINWYLDFSNVYSIIHLFTCSLNCYTYSTIASNKAMYVFFTGIHRLFLNWNTMEAPWTREPQLTALFKIAVFGLEYIAYHSSIWSPFISIYSAEGFMVHWVTMKLETVIKFNEFITLLAEHTSSRCAVFLTVSIIM